MSSTSLWLREEELNEEDIVLERCSSSSGCTSSSRSHYSVEPESCPWTQHAEVVSTPFGGVRVTVCGDSSCPALLTYHDIGLNHSTCFQGLLLCEETASILLQTFCIYHLDAPGHEADAVEGDPDDPYLSAEDMADQAAAVAVHYGLKDVTCLGVTSGAYIVTLMAIRHPQLVTGLILVSPVCRAATWAEWANMKVLMTTLSFYGMARHVKDYLLERYFCQDQSGYHGPGTDSLLSFRRELDERDPESLMRYMCAMHQRQDLTPHLSALKARILVIVGALSPFVEEASHLLSHTNSRLTTYCEVEACGSLVTEERPQAMQDALRWFCRSLPTVPGKGKGLLTSPDRRFASRSHHSLICSARSSPPGSLPSTPESSVPSTFFDGTTRNFVARSPRAVAFEELSLEPMQQRLRPIRTRAERRIVDSDDESVVGSATMGISSTCSSTRLAPHESHPVMSPAVAPFPAQNLGALVAKRVSH